MRKVLEGVNRYNKYNEHMDAIKGCLDALGVDISFPWLYGATGQAFVLNMNADVFVDAAQVWDIDSLFALGPNLGWQIDRLQVEHKVALELAPEVFEQAQRTAWDFARDKLDAGYPCYAWELSPIPNYNVIYGYEVEDNDLKAPGKYLYKGYFGEDQCPWDKLGTYDVIQVHMLSVIPCEASSPAKTVGDALGSVLDRVEKPDGWAISERYTTGLAGYKVWAQALDKGIANRDGQSYLNQVWLECREMAVEFLIEARAKLPWTADDAFDRAIDHYSAVRDHLLALRNLLPNREKQDWSTLFSSAEGAELVRKAAQAERQGVESLHEIVEQLGSNEQ